MRQRLSQVVEATQEDTFKRALIFEQAADVQPLRMKLKLDTPVERVRVRSRHILVSDQIEWLQHQMQQQVAADWAWLNRRERCASVAMPVPNGRRFRIVADYTEPSTRKWNQCHDLCRIYRQCRPILMFLNYVLWIICGRAAGRRHPPRMSKIYRWLCLRPDCTRLPGSHRGY